MLPVIRRRLLLGLLAAASLSGCAVVPGSGDGTQTPGTAKTPAKTDKSPAKRGRERGSQIPQGKSAWDRPDAPHAIPVFMADAGDAPALSLDQQIRIVFSERASAWGAPSSVPPLRAMVVTEPGSVRAILTALGMTVWRLSWDGTRIEEARSPGLDARVRAPQFLRDLTFSLWPAESVRAAAPAGWTFSERTSGGARIRELRHSGVTALRATVTEAGSRMFVTVANGIEGYTLHIESLH